MTRSADSIQDEFLVLAAQAGDVDAFGAVLRRWLPVMRRHALRLTGNADAAEEVSQETCLALISALARLRDPALARGWMLRIVTHKSANWVRRQRRDRKLTHAIQNREPRAVRGDLHDESESHERAARIREACTHLPTNLRSVVSLYYGEGMSVAAIAEGLGVPEGTIKSRLHEARAELRAIYERNTK